MPMKKKNENLNLRISEQDRDLIAQAAGICGKSVSAFVIEASIYSAQKELMDQRFIGVTSDVFDTIDGILQKKGQANPELVKLFNKNINWID